MSFPILSFSRSGPTRQRHANGTVLCTRKERETPSIMVHMKEVKNSHAVDRIDGTSAYATKLLDTSSIASRAEPKNFKYIKRI